MLPSLPWPCSLSSFPQCPFAPVGSWLLPGPLGRRAGRGPEPGRPWSGFAAVVPEGRPVSFLSAANQNHAGRPAASQRCLGAGVLARVQGGVWTFVLHPRRVQTNGVFGVNEQACANLSQMSSGVPPGSAQAGRWGRPCGGSAGHSGRGTRVMAQQEL